MFCKVGYYLQSSIKSREDPSDKYLLSFVFSYIKQERQCTYNVTMKYVRATIVVVGRQQVLNIVSVCL